MKKEWTGLWVCKACWEPRHPQDSVKGVKDHQSVPVSRPAINTALSSITLGANAAKDATSLTVSDATNIHQYDGIIIILDDGTAFSTFVTAAPVGTTVTINNGLYGAAASGNTVYITGAGSFLTYTTTTASDL